MLRAIIYGLISIFLITIVRMFIGIIGRAFSEQNLESHATPGTPPRGGQGGELKKCVVCQTYSPVSAAPKIRGVEAFICSDTCAAKYRG